MQHMFIEVWALLSARVVPPMDFVRAWEWTVPMASVIGQLPCLNLFYKLGFFILQSINHDSLISNLKRCAWPRFWHQVLRLKALQAPVFEQMLAIEGFGYFVSSAPAFKSLRCHMCRIYSKIVAKPHAQLFWPSNLIWFASVFDAIGTSLQKKATKSTPIFISDTMSKCRFFLTVDYGIFTGNYGIFTGSVRVRPNAGFAKLWDFYGKIMGFYE